MSAPAHHGWGVRVCGAGTLPAVRAPKQNCPRCEAEQSFRPRHRDTNGKPGVVEVYIKCTVCRWEKVLRKSTAQIEILADRERRLVNQGAKEEKRYGVVKGSTANLLRNVRNEMKRLRVEAGLA